MSKAEDYLKQTLEEYALSPLGGMSNKGLSDTLSRLFVTKVLPELGHVDASDYFEVGYTDGSGDLGIDLIIKVAKEVHIIQTKYASFNKPLKREHLDTFQGILGRLANRSFDTLKNKRLIELLEDIEWDKDHIFFWFVTNARLDNQARAATEIPIVIPKEMTEKWGLTRDKVEYEYIDQERLYEALTELQSNSDRSGVAEVEIRAAKQSGKGRSELIVLEEDGLKSAIVVIESEQIARYCRGASKNTLFDFNIRNYLGENKKNKQILKTARDEPESFFLYNNGVSAICEHLEINESTGQLKAQRFSVINGAQTVRSLSKLSGGRQPKILLRVTEIPNHKERRGLIKGIVRYNNTQNEIKSSDFRSNDAIQASIKDQFHTLTKDGKTCDYASKRTDSSQRNKLTHKIEMTNFAKAIFCYSLYPYELQAQGSGILFDPSKDYYEQIFGPENGSIAKDDFLEKAGIYFTWELVDEWTKTEKARIKDLSDDDSKKIKNALERKTILMWMLRHFFQRLERESSGAFSERAYLQKLALAKTFKIEHAPAVVSFLMDSLEQVKTFVVYQYGQLTAQGITQRQWVRGLQGVKENLEGSIRMFPNLTAGVKHHLGKI